MSKKSLSVSVNEKQDVFQRIKENYHLFSKGQCLVADYIQNNYEKTAGMTALCLANEVGISEASVVRFALLLGYDGYPKLKKALQEASKAKLTTLERIELSHDEDIIVKVIDTLNQDMKNIKDTLDDFDSENFKLFIEEIKNARNVYIIGFRTSSVLSEYLGFYLNLLLKGKVSVVKEGVSNIYEQLINLNKEDVIIGITFPRYSSKTYKYVNYSKESGAKILALTDNSHAPIVKISNRVLYAKSNIDSFVDTLVAPLSLINALVIGVGMLEKEKTKEVFSTLERVWNEQVIYEK